MIVIVEFFSSVLQPFVKNEIYEEEIGDGNLNDVTRVSSKTEDGRISLILKKSLPYIKVSIKL